MNIETKMSNKDRFEFYVPAIGFGLNKDGPFLCWILDGELPQVTSVDIEMVKMDIDRLAILWEKRCFDYIDEQLAGLGLVPLFDLGFDIREGHGEKSGIRNDGEFEIDNVILNQNILGKLHGEKLDKFLLKNFTTIKSHVDELSNEFVSEDFTVYIDAMDQVNGEAA
jgi:hypothetical protein